MCEWTVTTCDFKGCGRKMLKKDMAAHVSECAFRVVQCRCGHATAFSALKEHQQQTCLLTEIPCPYAKYGCEATLIRLDFSEHEDREWRNHLRLVENFVEKLELQYGELQREIAELRGYSESKDNIVEVKWASNEKEREDREEREREEKLYWKRRMDDGTESPESKESQNDEHVEEEKDNQEKQKIYEERKDRGEERVRSKSESSCDSMERQCWKREERRSGPSWWRNEEPRRVNNTSMVVAEGLSFPENLQKIQESWASFWSNNR
eukprot:TRINITY_DN3794_c0_g1_i3.p1 TRINITY_DN3794_c0_g1~~TRINITY_DN3794_c0_g1_i3.p1  ORF type:complete len:266 (-),score=53.60 TRINITY_DN3794_c0_g1_i3:77-874(-)